MSTMRIPTEFTAVDKFTSVVSKMTGSVDKFGKTSEAAISRFNAKANKIAGNMAIAGGAITGLAGLAVNSSSKFESSMSNVATLVDTNTEDMGKMSEEVLKMAKSMPVPIEELTTSLYDIRSAGISAEKAMGALETSGKLSKAGLSTTSEATNILTSAMNAFASEGLKSDEIANILFKTVKAGKTNMSQLAQAFGATAPIIQSSGVALADFQAATAALTTVGTPASQAQNQIRAAVIALQKPTADMEKIFKKLGVSSEKELIKREGSLVGAFNAVNNAGTKMGINLAKAWSSTEAGAAVTSLLGSTNEVYVNTLKDMQSGTDALTGAYEKQLNTTASKTQIAKNNMEALSITVGTQLAPILSSLIDAVTPVITGFTSFISKNEWLSKTIAVVGVGLLVFSGIIKGVTIITTAYTYALKLWTGAQWLLNAAMTANPIVLIIAGIVALIALVVAAIYKWNEWGAAILLMLGPIGWLINLIMNLRKHWDSIVSAFQTDGIIAGLKRIGVVIMDSMLYPIQQFLELIGSIPGVGKLVQPALALLQAGRDKLGVTDTKEVKPIASPEQQQAQLTKESVLKGSIGINVNDKNGVVSGVDSNFGGIPVNTTTTLGMP